MGGGGYWRRYPYIVVVVVDLRVYTAAMVFCGYGGEWQRWWCMAVMVIGDDIGGVWCLWLGEWRRSWSIVVVVVGAAVVDGDEGCRV